jgi:hypothetical protein
MDLHSGLLLFPKPQKKTKKKKPHKYKIKKVEHAGRTFDSALERDLYDDLLLRESRGELMNIQSQVTIYMTAARIGYRVDYAAWSRLRGRQEYFEAKGFPTPEWEIKRRLYRYYGPGPLYVYVREGKRGLKLSEVITIRAEAC